ncbi:MAG: alpha/beta hydrolase [Bacteroidales bacterium]
MNRSIHFEGIIVRYSDCGSGRPLILLHGYLLTGEVWQPLSDIISKSFRVISVDIPGHGGSGVAGDTHTMEFIAGAVRAVMNDTGEKKVLLAGHSLGGYATLAFAEKYPELLAGYVLFHSHPYADSPETILKRKREIEVVKAGKKDLMYPANISMMFAERNLEIMPAAVTRLREIASHNPAEGIIALLNGMIVRHSRTNVVESGELPLLWILGRWDRYFSPGNAVRDIKLPSNARVEILENSGHLGFVEETELSAELIRIFASGLDWKPDNGGTKK